MSAKRTPLVLAGERRREIISLVKKDGRVAVEDLVRRFKVSAVTLRADLRQLAEQGVLVRSYGGAMLPQEADQDVPLNIKQTIHHAEKVRIGEAAAKLIRSHQTVILDSGTTSAEVAKAIKRANLSALTVITHALNIAQEFTEASNVSVIMIGGLMRHVSGSFVGPQAERMIRELHADHFFLGVDGIDPEIGLSTPDLLEAQLNRWMMQVSQEVTVIADASKIGRRSLSVIGEVTAAARMVTDNRINADALQSFRQRGIEVIVA
jgi:DeoR family transcriptional regulator of aga operon